MNQAPKSQPPNMILLCQDRLLLELGEGKESEGVPGEGPCVQFILTLLTCFSF